MQSGETSRGGFVIKDASPSSLNIIHLFGCVGFVSRSALVEVRGAEVCLLHSDGRFSLKHKKNNLRFAQQLPPPHSLIS